MISQNHMQYDFVAIGDITTDAFIKLKDADELMNHGTRELCVRFADKVPYEYVETQPGLPTNYHYVLWFGAERTILVKQTKFTYSMPAFEKPPKYIYLTSLGESAKEFHHEVARYIREHPETKLAFQPGTFQIKLGAEELKDVYAVTELFF